MPITADEYKSLMSQWATGITVVTTSGPEGTHGMTANSFTGVSLQPPLVLVCVDHRARTHEHLQETGLFGIHILHSGQEELAKRCAGLYGEAGNRLGDVPHESGPHGAPLLSDCLVALECRLYATYEGGDHTIFLGEVESTRIGDGTPLLYFNRAFRTSI
jgi:flavin reductase (DIM6/NTAB) family NADH-FMN oxidoreductase RutF